MGTTSNRKKKKKKVSKAQIREKKKRRHIRKVFNLFYEEPRITTKEASEELEIKESVVRLRVNQAYKEGYIQGPQIRKMSFKNFMRYEYFLNVDEPLDVYERLKKNENILYLLILNGPFNLSIFSKEKITIDGKLVFGPCTDRYLSYPPNISWGTSMQNQRKMIEEFNPDEYSPKNYIENHWDQTAEWTEKDEKLYGILKYKIRQPFSPIMRKYHIQRSVIIDWLEKVPECCKYYTAYFPETINAYLPFIYMFDTDYEDFVIDLFSQLPTTIYYYKIADKFILHTWLDMAVIMYSKPSYTKISKELPFLKIIRDLKRKKIVKSESNAFVHCYWRREVD